MTADAPKAASSGRSAPDESWVTANATKLPHRGDNYKPSFTGRLGSMLFGLIVFFISGKHTEL